MSRQGRVAVVVGDAAAPLPGIKLFRCSANFVMLSSFERTKSIPIAEASDLPRPSTFIVNRMIRTPGLVRFKIDAASMPLRFGIARSRSTTSGRSFLAFSTASTPELASAQTLNAVWFSTKVRSRTRMLGLSSAMRMPGIKPTKSISGIQSCAHTRNTVDACDEARRKAGRC